MFDRGGVKAAVFAAAGADDLDDLRQAIRDPDSTAAAGRPSALTAVAIRMQRILDLCDREMAADGTLRPIRPDTALRAAADLASAGLRVLATAVSWAADPDGFGDQQAHWCTILRSVVLDGPLMHPRCRRATALLA